MLENPRLATAYKKVESNKKIKKKKKGKRGLTAVRKKANGGFLAGTGRQTGLPGCSQALHEALNSLAVSLRQ